MQIKFLIEYDKTANPAIAQTRLLEMWQQSIQNNEVIFIPKADIEFNSYTFYEYPEPDKVKKMLLENSDCESDELEDLYNHVATEFILMELVITVKEQYEIDGWLK